RRERDVVDVGGMRAGLRPTPIEQVRGDERAEEQAVRRQEQPHGELRIADAGARGVSLVAGFDDVVRGRDGFLVHRHGSVWGSMPHAYMPNRSGSAPNGTSQMSWNTAA